jgi:hypothetical protein
MKTKKTIRSLVSVSLGLFAFSAFAHEAGAPLTDFQKNYLKQYDGVRAALAADDLAAAKKAAGTPMRSASRTGPTPRKSSRPRNR